MGSVTKIESHPFWPNKVRVTFDQPIDPATVATGNFQMQWVEEYTSGNRYITGDGPDAEIVPGSSDLQLDIAMPLELPTLDMANFAFDEAPGSGPTAADPGVFGDLTFNGGDADGVEIVHGFNHYARRFSGDVAEYAEKTFVIDLTGTAQDMLYPSDSFCMHAGVKMEGPRTTPATIVSMQGTDADQASDEQFRVQVETDGRITWFWETGIRVPQTGTSDRGIPTGRACVISLTRRAAGAGLCDVDLFVDADFWQGWTGVPVPDGGDSATVTLCVGKQGAGFDINPFKGVLSWLSFGHQTQTYPNILNNTFQIRPFALGQKRAIGFTTLQDMSGNPMINFFSVFHWPRAADYAINNFEMIDQPLLGTGPSVPTITLISPPSPGPIELGELVVVEAVNAIDTTRVMVVAVFEIRGFEEVVHNGQRFSANYNGRSSREAITDGFRYSIVRNGGWFENPRIQFYAIDQLDPES